MMRGSRLGFFFGVLAVMTWCGAAGAQPFECDDNYGECGTPQQSGGGGGGGGGSILINNTDLGDTYQYADDYDDDGIEDPFDNCPYVQNPDQVDDDGDQIGSACDNCPQGHNPEQADLDGDLTGDLCDADMDNDGVDNDVDLCPFTPDPLQSNVDDDEWGDACDDDMDNDGVPNLEDNCPLVANPDQADDDPGSYGDACDMDDDGDGIRNTFDNCPHVANYEQMDLDEDGLGDACDADKDEDGIVNAIDNCEAVANDDQSDLDRDGVGEVCDDRYCYVVFGDHENCLDPTEPFTVYSPSIAAETGADIRLRLFTNHVNQPLRYTWEIIEAPGGSGVSIENPSGAATISTPYEYHYLADRIVSVIPDRPGTYEVHVVVELVWADMVTGEMGGMSEAYSIIQVTGDPVSSCSISADGNIRGWSLSLLLLAGGLVAVRRRR